MTLLRLCIVGALAIASSLSVSNAQTPGAMQQQRDRMATMDRDRVGNDLSSMMPTDRRGRKLNPSQVLTAAKAGAKTAGISCEVVEGALLGVTNDRNDLFEVACKNGPGYIFTSPGKTEPLNCLILAAQAERMKADGNEPPPNATCGLKGNQNTTAIFAGYAREAGVPCQVDAGVVLGVNAYEIGCTNADGYIIERKEGGAWTKAPCWRMAASNDAACRLSTAAESNSAWTEILAGTDASACTAEKARQVGVDSEGLLVYEVKCSGGAGFMTRVNETGKAVRVHACSDPATASIAGGCMLTKP
jgi:hypothetical protein